MPQWFIDLSLRAKFVTVTMLVGRVATAVATISFLAYADSGTRAGMMREATVLAQVLAENAAAAVVFDDAGAAAATLSAVRVKKEIRRVRILLPDGTTFAGHGAIPPEEEARRPVSPGPAVFGAGHLWVSHPVTLDGETVGTVELVASLEALQEERGALIAIAGAIVLVSTLIAFALSSTLQRVVVRPITQLAGVIREVSADRAYDRRAVRETSDELGDLITGFNQMLEQIEAQHGELARYREELERRVLDRTAELHEANVQLHGTIVELRASQADLEQANRTKSSFLANMSHELRTPLNAIIGFSEIMEAGMFGPVGNARYEGYARDISRSAGHLLDIINDILDMTRVESGKLSIHEENVGIGTLLDDALRMVAPLMQAKSIRLHRRPPDGPLPMLHCDPVRTRQVLINILSNATKFTEAGGSVSVRLAIEDGLAIEVADTGIGIAEADLARVLTPFVQVENAYSRQHRGTGLGLPLSKALMEMHQGRLELSSRLGAGTTVRLWFPAARLRPAPAPAAPAPAPAEESRRAARRA